MRNPVAFRGVPLVAMLLAPCIGDLALAQTASRVDQAISFLRAACVTSGSSLDLRLASDGSVQVDSIQSSGVRGTITLTKKELEGFADAASALAAHQASEMRGCMKPHVDKILTALLTGSAAGAPETITIQTGGSYFVASEFDKVMAAAAEKPTSLWTNEGLSKIAGLHPAKIRLYVGIAVSNRLGDMFQGAFTISDRGASYVLSRGLVK